ncbi:MAG TPA: TolC family protein [Candidatus Acidoferrum sp.]|nr:TolC family protein [Candidatus Acidoferrum sp.]
MRPLNLNCFCESALRFLIAGFALANLLSLSAAQQPDAPEPQKVLPAHLPQPQTHAPSTSAAIVELSLQQALDLAQKNSPQLQAAMTDAGNAREDKNIARAGLLPEVNFNTAAIYTQTNGNGQAKYIANNGPHEYISQGNVHQQLDLASIAGYRRTAALAAAAKARKEIASRGLTVTVVQDYFALAAAEQKLDAAKRTADEGEKFFQLTQSLEKGGEVAHTDVIRAELQMTDRRRQLQEAQLALQNARLDLAVLIFRDFNDNFRTTDDLHASIALPLRDAFEAQAGQNNPEIRAALAEAQASNFTVNAAKAGYFPSIGLDYFYGIDAARYATYTTTDGTKLSNLGSSGIVSLSLPVWNWGATQSRVRQAELKRDLAKKELSFAQRKLLAEMRSLYEEAETALNELAGLQRSAELSAESLRLTTLRYKNGEGTVLEVVDAQTTFAQSHSAYQDGAVRYRVALANLQTLTGVLANP